MTSDDKRLEAALGEAAERLRAFDWSSDDADAWSDARQRLLEAERALYEARGEPYADELPLPVCWRSGAPYPVVVTWGGRTVVGYYVDPSTIEGDVSSDDPVGATRFERCHALMRGPPGGEDIERHPLWGHGLGSIGAFAVRNSPWLADLRARDLPLAPDVAWQHFVLIFQDETVEAIAESRTSTWFDRSDLLDAAVAFLRE